MNGARLNVNLRLEYDGSREHSVQVLCRSKARVSSSFRTLSTKGNLHLELHDLPKWEGRTEIQSHCCVIKHDNCRYADAGYWESDRGFE